MAGRNDVISGTAEVSDVILGARVVARVFEGRPGMFWWVPALTDEQPQGPFQSREDAEIAADIECDQALSMQHWLQMLDT